MNLKTFLSILFLAVSLSTFAQQKNQEAPTTLYTNEAGSFYLDTVMAVDGATEAELFQRFKNWYVSNVRSISSNSAVLDENNLVISDDITMSIERYTGVKINFKFIANFKDNRFKLDCKSFKYLFIGGGPIKEVALEDFKSMGHKRVKREFDKQFEELLTSIYAHMQKGEVLKKKDW